MTTPEATSFQSYSVPSQSGPHVTMQAGIVQAGRFWTTTAATSLKARSVRAHGHAGVAIADGDCARIVSGRTVALRPFRPWRAFEDPIAGSLWGLAVARLGRTHLDQILGYLEASGSIPSAWLPTRRVLLVTRIDRSLRLCGDEVVDRGAGWGPGCVLRPTEDGTANAGQLPVGSLPDSHRSIIFGGGRVNVGVSTPTGPVALPGRWCGDGRVEVSAAALATVMAEMPGTASVVFDQSSSRRPDEKLGVMFRGTAYLVDVADGKATVRFETRRVTTWDGFDADSFDVSETPVT